MSVDDFIRFLEAIEGRSASTWFIVAGLGLLYVSYKQLESGPPPTRRWLTVAALAAGLSCLIASPALSFWYIRTPARVSPSAAFAALKVNKKVEWLIRLVPSVDQSLTLAKLEKLGRPDHDFVFVGDYDELKNYTVEEAIYKTGGSLRKASRVAAIVFPLKRRDLYPASAMGVLQVLQRVDRLHDGEEGYTTCTPDVSKAAAEHLTQVGIPHYAWAGVSPYFSEYAAAERRLRAQQCSAYQKIGSIAEDWEPAGYSRVVHPRAPDLSGSFQLSLPDGTIIPIRDFGSRAFLLENLTIGDVGDRVMIDFDNPDEDRIPDLAPTKGGGLGFGN